MLRAYQLVDSFLTDRDAEESLAFLRTQVDFLGGRVLPATAVHPTPRVQAFFAADVGALESEWLPDGVRLVLVPASIARTLGIGEVRS